MYSEHLEEIKKLSNPLIKFLNDNFHPHVKIIIDCGGAELVEGLICHKTDDYIKD